MELAPSAKWYDARSYILGINYHNRNLRLGIKLARRCRNHPGCEEAAWFCELIDQLDEWLKHDDIVVGMAGLSGLLRKKFDESGGKDGRALFFLQTLSPYWEDVKGAAELGYPLAMAVYADHLLVHNEKNRNRAYELAKKAAAAGEPEAMYLLAAVCKEYGDVMNLQIFRQIAKLGHVTAQRQCVLMLENEITDPELWFWRCRIAPLIDSAVFVKQVNEILGSREHARCLFQIGRWYQSEGSGLGVKRFPTEVFIPTVLLWVKWCRQAKEAVETWLLCARRIPRMSKDIRQVIGKMVWDRRDRWV